MMVTHGNEDDGPIPEMIANYDQVMSRLDPTADFSLRLRVEADFKKALLLSAASFFESRLTDTVLRLFREYSGGNEALVQFVRAKAVARRYHDWFDWDRQNTNKFYGAFGEGFKEHMRRLENNDDNARDAARDFIRVGRERNRLVHNNFATQSVDLTIDEIVEVYENALRWVDEIPNHLRQFLQSATPTS